MHALSYDDIYSPARSLQADSLSLSGKRLMLVQTIRELLFLTHLAVHE